MSLNLKVNFMDSISIADSIAALDTIVKSIENPFITSSEMADIYKEIINSQTQTYNFIISVFLGIIAFFAGATYIYNTRIVKSEIKKETESIFKDEKQQIIDHVKASYEHELNFLKAERARLFAISITENECGDLFLRFMWLIESTYYYNLAKIGATTRMCLENAIEALEKALKKNDAKNKCKVVMKENITTKPIDEIIKELPDELDPEKKKLEKLLSKLEEEEK